MAADPATSGVDRSRVRPALLVGLWTVVFVAATFAVALALGTMHPTDLVVAGQQGPSVGIITEDFGPPTNPRPGYDGQQVYALARTFPDLDAAAPHLDAPRYRSLRILHPALAAPAPAGTPTVLALLAVSAVGVGLCAWGVADLAGRHGWDRRIGLVAVPALALGVSIGTDEPLAYGLAFAAVAALDRRAVAVATALGTAAVLSKESALVVLAAAVGGLLLTRRWWALPVVVVPAAVLVGWWLALGAILGGGAPRRADLLAVADQQQSGVAATALVMACGLAGAWWWRRVPAVWPIGVAFGLWPLAFSIDMLDWLALVRVASPALVVGLSGGVGALLAAQPTRKGSRLGPRTWPPAHVTALGSSSENEG